MSDKKASNTPPPPEDEKIDIESWDIATESAKPNIETESMHKSRE